MHTIHTYTHLHAINDNCELHRFLSFGLKYKGEFVSASHLWRQQASSPKFSSERHKPDSFCTQTRFMCTLQMRFNGGCSPPNQSRTTETKHNHSEIRIQFSLRLLQYEYISVILKSEVIHRKQPKNFTKGESRRLQGSTSETVRAQLWPKLSFCIAVIVYCQSKVKAIHYMLAVAGHHFTRTYGWLLISRPEMLFST